MIDERFDFGTLAVDTKELVYIDHEPGKIRFYPKNKPSRTFMIEAANNHFYLHERNCSLGQYEAKGYTIIASSDSLRHIMILLGLAK
jgi:hypothetical protein